jgi:uncharacterized membrane protein
MTTQTPRTGTCQVCGQEKKFKELLPATSVRQSLADLIKNDKPGWTSQGHICYPDHNKYRLKYIERTLTDEQGDLTNIDKRILDSFKEQELISKNLTEEFDKQQKFGTRLADRIAKSGGSWPFIIFFGVFILCWIAVNVFLLIERPYDPYPFILLNLILSCLAALQAPVIMMSQNRQQERELVKGDFQYETNLKSELQVRSLHEKVDHLMISQWQRLMEIQQIQLELMQDIAEKKK